MNNSEDRQFASDVFESESVPRLQRTIHPDTAKFMDMAKELLDSPAVQQAVENENQKQQASN